MAIYGTPLTLGGGGGGKNDTLPPLLDNFKAKKTESGLVSPTANTIAFKDIPDGSKIKLVKGSNISGTVTYGKTTDLNHRIVFDSNDWTKKTFKLENDDMKMSIFYSDIDQWLNSTKDKDWWRKVGMEQTIPPSYSNESGFLYQLGITDEVLAQNFNDININATNKAKVGLPWSVNEFPDYTFFENFQFVEVGMYVILTDNEGSSSFTYNYNSNVASKAPPTASGLQIEAMIHPMMEPKPETPVALDSDGSYYMFEDVQKVTLSADKMPVSRANDLAGAVWVYGDHIPNNVNDGTKIELNRNDVVSSELGLSLTLGELAPSTANVKVVVNIPETDGNLHPYIYLTNQYYANGVYQDVGILLRDVCTAGVRANNSNTNIFSAGLLVNECSKFASDTLGSSIKPYNEQVNIEELNYINSQIEIHSYKCFILSKEELGFTSNRKEGKPLPYFDDNTSRIAKLNGNNNAWWSRTIESGLGKSIYVTASGNSGISNQGDWSGFRPAIAVSLDLPLNPIPKEDGSYDFLETAKSKVKIIKETKQTVGNIPSKSKVKLGRYGENELLWLTTKDAEGRQYLQLDSGNVALAPFKAMMYDNREPNNTDTNIRNHGNNMFTLSNLFQWLNSDKSANNWYTPQHAYDAPPPYANQDGFLKDWTEQEKQILLNKVWETSVPKTVSTSLQKFTAKVVVPSMTEVGISSNMGGSKLDIYANKFDWEVIDDLRWTRSSDPNNTYMVRCVDFQGDGFSSNCIRAGVQVVPLVSIPVNTPVELGPDGAYRLLLDVMLPTVKVTVTYPKNKDFYARQFTYNPKNQHQTMLEGAIATVNDIPPEPPEPEDQEILQLPSKSKIKLGKWNNTVLKWIVCRDSVDNSIRLILDTDSMQYLGRKQFDAPETSNSNGNRRNYGNNRYIWSNIHQWLNTALAAYQWYTKQHSVDATPSYHDQAGFLNQWSEKELAVLELATWNVLKANLDGGGVESYQSKITLPSISELTSENNRDGNKLDIFTDDESRKAPYGYWVRTPISDREEWVQVIEPSGHTSSTQCSDTAKYIRPICKPIPTTLVSLQPDSDGCYTLV